MPCDAKTTAAELSDKLLREKISEIDVLVSRTNARIEQDGPAWQARRGGSVPRRASGRSPLQRDRLAAFERLTQRLADARRFERIGKRRTGRHFRAARPA